MAVLLLAFVLALEHLCDARATLSWRTLLPAVILVAGGVYTYSYTAIAWFAGTVVIWLLAETASRPRQIFSAAGRQRVRAAAAPVGLSVLLLVVLVLPVLSQILSFFSSVGFSPASSAAIPTSDLRNLIHPLSVYESLGIWWSPDFRVDPVNGFHAGQLATVAVAALAFGLLWALRRRQYLLPAAVATSLIIWWRANATQSPYVAAKALVIVAPLVMALTLRALFTVRPTRPCRPSARVGPDRRLLRRRCVFHLPGPAQRAGAGDPVRPRARRLRLAHRRCERALPGPRPVRAVGAATGGGGHHRSQPGLSGRCRGKPRQALRRPTRLRLGDAEQPRQIRLRDHEQQHICQPASVQLPAGREPSALLAVAAGRPDGAPAVARSRRSTGRGPQLRHACGPPVEAESRCGKPDGQAGHDSGPRAPARRVGDLRAATARRASGSSRSSTTAPSRSNSPQRDSDGPCRR